MVSNYKRKTNKASYSRETLQEAVKAVKHGVLSGYKAAQIYKIPRMTIMDHVNNKRIKSKTLGRNTALSIDVEKKLASYLHIMEKNGFGLSKTEVLEMVSHYVQQNKLSTPFTNGIPGNAWFAAFKTRNSLSLKKPQAVEFARKKAVDPFIVQSYFDLLNNTLTDLNLWDKPGQIWNLDETSFSKDPQKTKIVGLKGHAATRVIASPGKDNTTVLLGANAAGEKLAPLVIFKGKHMWDEWTSPKAYPGTTYAATTNGWMETAIFERYFKKTFLSAVGDVRPVILIYDGHATHVGLNIIEEARKNDVTILKLPAHTSHVLQPLDIAVMKSFKDRWDPLLVKWQRLNVGITLPKKEFARLIGEVWSQINSQVLRNGFRKAGIFPFNPSSIEEKHFDALKLEKWKNLQDLGLQKVLSPHVASCSNYDAKTESRPTKNEPKTLLTLALNCITKVAYTSSFCVSEVPVTSNKTIKVLEDRIVSFEELLLMKVKAGNNVKTKRQRVAPGAEVITHQDVVLRKIEEKLKSIKKEPKPQKSNQPTLGKKTANLNVNEKKLTQKSNVKSKFSTLDSTHDKNVIVTSNCSENTNKSKTSDVDLSLPGPSGLTKNYSIREHQPRKIVTVTKKGKGIGKTSNKVKEESQKTLKKTPKRRQKRAYVSSSTSTSVSDCMTIHSDSDIFDFVEDLNESFSETPEDKTMSLKEKCRSQTVNEKTERVGYQIIRKSEEDKFESESSYDNRCDLKNVTVENTQIENYTINDEVLVRYYGRNKWTYYAGYVEEVIPGDDDVYYKIRYYKTITKPLKFTVKKKIDRDVVPSINILKKISLYPDPNHPKEFKLSNDEDKIYFT